MKKILNIAKKKAFEGARINFDEAVALYQENDLLFLAECARKMKELKSGKKIFYTVNRHINLTNICSSNCPLCAFQVSKGDKRGFVLESSDIEKILRDCQKIKNLTEIHIVSALHPKKIFDYYLNVVRQVKTALPNSDVKAFTPVEIVNFSKISGKNIREVLLELQKAGLDSLPGGGAEILSDRVRKIICPKKATAAEWLKVMREAHNLGIRTNASIMYGHVETLEERLEHLFTLRNLQDETGGFQAFMLFPFHPANTKLGAEKNIKRKGSFEDLKMLALSRIILDNIDHFKAFWIMLTMPVAQIALAFGADDLDGTIGEEKIIHAAGAKTSAGITIGDLEKVIRETGYEPIQRDTFYREVKK